MTTASAQFDRLCQILRQESGVVLTRGKEYLVESRLAPLANEHGLPSIDALIDRVVAGKNRQLLDAVLDAMTTNETSFMRDKQPFEALANVVLPELIRARQSRKRLHIWSAACSTGQEPYSIAMLLADRFPQLASWDVKILASDLSQTALAKASIGRYSEIETNRGLPANMKVSHFARDGAHWVAKPVLKKLTDFRRINLIRPFAGIPMMDVIFLRNVLIYFDGPTKSKVLDRMHTHLAKDGVLFLGAAESTSSFTDKFEHRMIDKTSCYRPT